MTLGIMKNCRIFDFDSDLVRPRWEYHVINLSPEGARDVRVIRTRPEVATRYARRYGIRPISPAEYFRAHGIPA